VQNLNPILLLARSGMADINMKVASTRDEEEKRNITRTHATPCRGGWGGTCVKGLPKSSPLCLARRSFLLHFF
jgi:hypothetical protein